MTNSPPKHVKVTSYMPPGTLADLDVLRAELRRNGTNVDRGAVIRAAIAVAQAHPEAWTRAIENERGEA
jgi:hypothetical protein